ncbi:hypothetical protein EDB19DRAFT_1729401 [Suillus lakei]|nr:hypothetical protein EDB19DRAFT_1729401 [Suillus lakei]
MAHLNLPAQRNDLVAQATFLTEDTIFVRGREHTKDGRLLGIKGCFNRPMSIWQLTLPTKIQCTTSQLTPPTALAAPIVSYIPLSP